MQAFHSPHPQDPDRRSKPQVQRPPKRRLFLESRYQKLERGLPQTIFYCPECKGHRQRRKDCERCEGFGKLTRDSVQELLSRRLLPAMKARFGKFHGAGREDVDVLMLGRGRPFVFEVVGARNRDVDLERFVEEFHEVHGDRVRLAPLRLVERRRVAILKETKYDKVYALYAELDGAVDPARCEELVGRRLEIVQRTPQRVAHRRADLERHRQVTIRELRIEGPDRIYVETRCEHGTYVKEWVSGDEERTSPSLAELLGTGARCVQLDVLDIMDQDA